MPGNGLYVFGLVEDIASVVIDPATVIGGIWSSGTVTLASPAPSTGGAVNLTSNSPYVAVNGSVGIAGGATSANFQIVTLQPPASLQATITADGGGLTKSAVLQVYADYVMGLSMSPASVGVPATVTVPAGATSANFTITPLKQFSNESFECDIYVSDGHSAKQAPLSIAGDSLFSVTFASPVVGGNTATGTVTLNFPAPLGGWLVHLSTQYPLVDIVSPVTLLVPFGQTSATFTVATGATGASYGCDVYASDGVSGKQTTLTVTHS